MNKMTIANAMFALAKTIENSKTYTKAYVDDCPEEDDWHILQEVDVGTPGSETREFAWEYTAELEDGAIWAPVSAPAEEFEAHRERTVRRLRAAASLVVRGATAREALEQVFGEQAEFASAEEFPGCNIPGWLDI